MAIISTSSPAAGGHECTSTEYPERGSPRQWPAENVSTQHKIGGSHRGCYRPVRAFFADARGLQADALEMLSQGRIRNAAEKAWETTKRATDALVLARTGEEPERTPETGAGLRLLESHDEGVRSARLTCRYYARQGHLHGECFYNGLCEPVEDTKRMIRRTAAYIEDAERLAAGDIA